MFANVVDIGFDDVLKMLKESVMYCPEMEDDKYSDLYKSLMDTSLDDYKRKMYFSRKEWPDCVYVRLDIARSENNIYENKDDDVDIDDVSELYKDLSIKEVIEKVENDEISFCLKHIFCNIVEDKLIEDHVIMIFHPTYSDLFTDDWCCYYFDD